MIDSLRSRVGIAVLVIVIAAILMIVGLSYAINGKIFTDNSNDDIKNSKKLIAYATDYNFIDQTYTPAFKYVNLRDMSGGSAIRFLNPFGRTMLHFPMTNDPNAAMTTEQKQALLKDADVFEQYILIRLPDELGGAVQNVSAFRAYSDLDPESKCMLGFRHDYDTGAFLQDPCHSDIFRVSDGYSCFGRIAIGTNPVVSGYNALPRIKLSIDDQGYLLAMKPDGQPQGDGTVGEGRILSIKEIQSGDKADPSCAIYNQRNQ